LSSYFREYSSFFCVVLYDLGLRLAQWLFILL
jgi:hypothetical protein